MADFLLEIGVEEIPARMLDGAREELKERLTKLISAEGMLIDRSKMNNEQSTIIVNH